MKLPWRLSLAAVLIALPLGAQTKFEFWPGTNYDPAIPTYAKVFGHEPGERILSPADLVKYLEALAAEIAVGRFSSGDLSGPVMP